jgi:energy-coupling factor transporter transmembrane protein EcfT
VVLIGQYIQGESIIHRLDPRVKIASVVGLSLIILGGTVLTVIMISIFVAMLAALSRLSFSHLYKALKPMFFFFILIFFLHLCFTDGTPIPPFPPWPVTITYEGIYGGALLLWKFILLLATASILTMCTSPTELVGGIEGMLRPFRRIGVPSQDIALMISMAMRFVPTLLEETQRIKIAQMARGANFGVGSLRRRAKATVSLMLPVILGSFRRADDLATAMEARGYHRGPRTYMRELRLLRADYVAVLVMVLIIMVHFSW